MVYCPCSIEMLPTFESQNVCDTAFSNQSLALNHHLNSLIPGITEIEANFPDDWLPSGYHLLEWMC